MKNLRQYMVKPGRTDDQKGKQTSTLKTRNIHRKQ